METHLYWISALTYAVVLGIILFNDIRANKRPGRLEKSYRLMSFWVLFFCIQDAVWGVCETGVIKGDSFFFISSSIFHISTVLTTFFWLKYVLEFLGDNVKHKNIYLFLDAAVILCEFVLVTVNFFHTTLFRIEDGNYITGYLRPLTFINQYVVYLLIGITTLFLAVSKRKKNVPHYRSVFLFTLAPILLGYFQLLFPEAPFYSLGYFLGCFIVHIFVVANSREVYLSQEAKFQRILELNNELEEKQIKIDEQFDILKSISGVFDYINLINFETNTASRFDIKDSKEEHLDTVHNPHTSFNREIGSKIDGSEYERFWTYTDLSTLEKRMSGKKQISSEFRYTNGDWILAMYIRIGSGVNKPLNHVAYAVRNITDDRRREEQVYYAMRNIIYSLHLFDLEHGTFERLIESDILKKIVGSEEDCQKMANTVIKATCKDEYLDFMTEFVNMSTVSERVKGKRFISSEFVGRFNGWTRMTFIPTEMNDMQVKKMLVITQIIDSEKNEMINLIYKSSTDELTRLYNRRMYEEELDAITDNKNYDKLVIVALDVNGLKTVNDTLGHKAGDELIIGAAKCMKKTFSSLGKVYRTGGDEFMAILRCEETGLKDALTCLDKEIESWSGNLVDSLSISYGYSTSSDYSKMAVRELVSEADKRMYEAKAAYYKEKGIDRRKS